MIVEISDLGFKAAEFTSAEFALSMIEGVEKVCFTVNSWASIPNGVNLPSYKLNEVVWKLLLGKRDRS